MTPTYGKYPILCVDDEQDNLVAFDLNFGDSFTVHTAGSGDEALRILRQERIAVLVVDQRMPRMSGMELLSQVRHEHPDCVAILLTAYRDIEVLEAALNSGLVYRYVAKPWQPQELEIVLRQAIERFALQDENRRLVRQLRELNALLGREVEAQYNFGDIIGSSAPLKALLETVSKVAPTRSTILVSGESGTGKELAARAIHNASPRRGGPFVRVNLAALSPTIIESELFGHEKGAFTGAVTQKLGRFELAHKGTLFLDEVGDLPPETQIKLLRVIQEREFERVGGAETVSVDVRLIAATNKDLAGEVREGRFREDLYYRINVFPILVPPLRDRKEDIPALARHFISRFEPGMGKAIQGLSADATALLMAYPWPGNVRELENALERAMILAEGDRIEAADLFFLRGGDAPPVSSGQNLDDLLGTLEKQQLQEALARHDGSVSAVARELGINRTTVYYRLKKYGLHE